MVATDHVAVPSEKIVSGGNDQVAGRITGIGRGLALRAPVQAADDPQDPALALSPRPRTIGALRRGDVEARPEVETRLRELRLKPTGQLVRHRLDQEPPAHRWKLRLLEGG